jgi:hypothetical protein
MHVDKLFEFIVKHHNYNMYYTSLRFTFIPSVFK